MKKNLIIIAMSVSILLLVAAGVVAALSFFGPDKAKTSTEQTPAGSPGSIVAVDQAPSLKTCELVANDAITASLGAKASSLTQGSRQGVVAITGTIAESCEYTFVTDKSSDNSLSLQTYVYDVAETDSSNSKEIVGAEWSQIIDAKQTSYFQQYKTSDGDTTISALRVIVGAHNYLFIMRQPVGAESFIEAEAQTRLLTMSEAANFELADEALDPDAPPAPDVPITVIND